MAEQDELNNSAEQFSSKMEDLSTSFKYINRNMSEMGDTLESSYGAMHQMNQAARDLGDSLKSNKDVMDKVVQGELSYSEVKKLQKQSQERINKLNEKREHLAKKLSTMGSEADRQKKASIERQIKKINALAKAEKGQIDDAAKVAKKGQSRLSSGFDKMGGLFGKMGPMFKSSSNYMKGLAGSARKAKIGSKGMLGFMGKFSGIMGKMMKANPFLMIAGALIKVFQMVLKVNGEVAQLGRDMGISAGEAAKVRQHFVNIANDFNEWGVDYDHIMESHGHLNEALGTSANIISGDVLAGMAMLQQRMHLSAESTVGFAKAALRGGDAVHDLAEESIRGARASEEEFGVRVDMNKVLERTGQIGGQIRGIYGANFELMSKSVAKAQLLGMELKDVVSSSKGMLNFHSSIEKEMKAELFLGKQLNLETARLASLTGDYDTYMDEIRKNAGDFLEFSRMNVLQQDALAGALGMSSDQLSDMLLQEEDLLALKERARLEGDKETLANLEQLSAQQAFQAALEKMKKLFINIAANLENLKIPGWLSKLLTGKRSTLKGKRLMDIHNEESLKDAMGKLTDKTTNEDIYDEETISGPRGRGTPSLPQQTLPRENIYGETRGGWTKEEKEALINGTYANKTITQDKFGTKNNNDYTKFSYGPKY